MSKPTFYNNIVYDHEYICVYVKVCIYEIVSK